jgi:hypothetical protein
LHSLINFDDAGDVAGLQSDRAERQNRAGQHQSRGIFPDFANWFYWNLGGR